MMNVKFEIRFTNSQWGSSGAITEDGAIRINLNLCRNPIVFISVFLHEIVHWLLDAMGYGGGLHYYLDLLYTHIGIYGRKVNRKKLRYCLLYEQNGKGGSADEN